VTTETVIHIVDDEEQVRNSLAFLLTVSGYTVRIHTSATGFLQLAPELKSACLITDLRMPDMSGVELLRRLAQAEATCPTVVITGHADVPMAVEAMKAGAIDFIEKPFEDVVLLAAVDRAIAEAERRGTADDVDELRARLDALTDRERQIMRSIVEGLPNKIIAYDLNISPRTVEVHRANVMAKMRAGSLAELVRMALRTELPLA
jgi:two-component system response regulator FixJ